MERPRWHARMGHCNKNVPQASKADVDKVKQSEISYLDDKCHTCAIGICIRKVHKSSESEIMASKRIEHVKHEVVPPMNVLQKGKVKYFVALLHAFSAFSMVKFLSCKYGALKAVKEMISQLENGFNNDVENISYSDRKTVK